MFCSSKTRLYQIIKTNLNNFHYVRNKSLLKLQNTEHFLIIQRGNSTRHNMLQTKIKSREVRKEDEIGPIGFILLGIPVVAFVLGTWQIERRKAKIALIDNLHARSTSPPVELPEDLSELESLEYCPVKVRGRFLHDREFMIGPRSLILKGAGASEGGGGPVSMQRNNTGYYLITPFQLEERDLTIMVNRGWVPRSYKSNRKLPEIRSDEVVEVIGVVRSKETKPAFMPENSPKKGSWFYRDLDAMAESAGTAPVYIELIADHVVPGGPIAGQTRVALRNEHMGYIVTWYSLAVITAFMWHRQFVRKLPLF